MDIEYGRARVVFVNVCIEKTYAYGPMFWKSWDNIVEFPHFTHYLAKRMN